MEILGRVVCPKLRDGCMLDPDGGTESSRHSNTLLNNLHIYVNERHFQVSPTSTYANPQF